MSTVFESSRHRFSRHECARMVEAGIFGPDDRVELLDGEILDRAPQRSRHATAVTLFGDALRAAFDTEVTVRLRLPLSLDEHSEPEPDAAILPESPRDDRDAHPLTALLVCEISDTRLALDRGKKLIASAKTGVPEYWMLDLNAERLEIYREPKGRGYSFAQVVRSDERVAPAFAPGNPVLVRDLLP
ncbi:Uma2 family endonuclease [Thiorhodococcus minor]|uniref:Uma2 family endonuclease n=1 Tax=Thiorhodococcus minor TaxID=57489 RepID=A0A6M0JUF2_9GAMM|nr:Uma2 family endonuclease [Thiorhodococcus minor]NEV61152.1 Uma2 family endonuclease [Thiorhodococcus minor]